MQLVVKYMCAASYKRSKRSHHPPPPPPGIPERTLPASRRDESDDVADEFPFSESLPPAGTRRDLKKRAIPSVPTL